MEGTPARGGLVDGLDHASGLATDQASDEASDQSRVTAPGVASDRTDWSLMCAGDEAAFARVYRRHADGVYNFAFRRLVSWEQAEEVLQATFTSVWAKARAGTLDGLTLDSARPLLLVMAGNHARNHVRRVRRSRALLFRVGHLTADEPDPADDVAGRLDDVRRMGELRAALDRLPRAQREVVELVAWSGCTVPQAAAALGVAEGTVKSRLSRARAQLRAAAVTDAKES